MENFLKTCRENHLKVTPQRVTIYRELIDDTDHPTAKAIYEKVRRIFPSISFDTVNRTLGSFARIGLIGAIECSGLGKKYDPNVKQHHHFKCMSCGAIIDFYHREFDEIKLPRSITKQFKVMDKKVVLTGVCPKCNKKGGK